MPVENQDVEVFANNPYELDIPVFQQDGTTPDNSISQARWWVARLDKFTGKRDILIKKDAPAISGNTITVTGDGTDTANLIPADYVHEAAIIGGDGGMETVTIGKFTVNATIIR
jgi:hypothetical protein